nr:MAG TPA: hypothetical protein [Caudoviricetes sp.]
MNKKDIFRMKFMWKMSFYIATLFRLILLFVLRLSQPLQRYRLALYLIYPLVSLKTG